MIVLSLLLTAVILIYISFQTQREQSSNVVQGHSRVVASEINAYVEDLQTKLSYLARVRGLTELPSEALLSLLEALVQSNSAYEAVAVFDKTGRVVSEVSPYGRLESDNLADSPPFIFSFNNEEYFVGPVELDSATQLPMVTLSVPIRNQQDQVDGVLLARVNLKFLWFVISRVEVGQTGYAYVLDNRNFVIADKEHITTNYRLEDISQHSFIQNLTSGDLKPNTYQGLRGTKVIGAISPIQSVHWNTVVELPTGEAYGPIRHMIFVMGGAVAVAVAFAIPISIFFSRRIGSPLQRLTEASAQIKAGNMEARVSVGGHDEIGILEETFNEMADRLEEYYVGMEQQVAERTQEVAATNEELQTANVSLENRTAALERSNQELQQFAYVASHDLQEPLRMVASFTQLLAQRYQGKLDADADEFIEYAVDGAIRMRQVIHDLLAYCQVGTHSKTLEPTDCNAVLEQTLANLRVTIEENQASVTHDELPIVEADAPQLGRVFQNLIANAIKFRRETRPCVHVSAQLEGAAWVFLVRDNGIGIDPEYAEQIFTIFQRLHTRKDYPGTGIGLAVCKKIVELHGGGDLDGV